LRDHHAASAAGVELARRALGAHHPLVQQIASDRRALEEIMRQLDVDPSGMKVTVARVAERFGRLKLNGRLFKPSPLSKVIELETLLVGVRGKEALWTALQRAEVSVEGLDLNGLVESARAQADKLEALRLDAAAQTFAHREGKFS
jgi:hypothetical protein